MRTLSLLVLPLGGLLAAPAAAGPIDDCGTGIVSGAEYCDDGNTVNGDGCSSACLFEVCGDGVVDPQSEQCDAGSLCEDGTTDCTVISQPGVPGGPLGDCTGIGAGTCAPRGGVGTGCSADCRLECGNGALDPGEECDPCDGCSELCGIEECGDGVIDCGEACDDGNTFDDDLCDSFCQFTECFPVTRSELRCVVEMNERHAAVWKAAGKVASGCVKAIARGKRTDDPPTCLASDDRGKLARAESATMARESRRCDPVDLPTFAYTDAATVNAAAGGGVADALADLLGAAPVANAKTQKRAAKCQREAVKALARLGTRAAKAFRKAKRDGLHGTRETQPVCTSLELADLGQAALRGEKVRKAATKTAAKIAKKCPEGDLSAWFGTGVDASSGATLGAQAAARTLCRLCLSLEVADQLQMDCDLVDDGDANASGP
jgi:cysteine-rich repeat protein